LIGPELPPGFAPHATFDTPRGSLRLGVRSRPASLWVVAFGYIGLKLLRRELATAAEFGNTHKEGWSYVVDTRAVWGLNTLNVFWLRQIPRLPNITGYFVIAPKWMQWLARPASVIIRPTAIVPTAEEALALTSVPSASENES
jgi:hypothetical protein